MRTRSGQTSYHLPIKIFKLTIDLKKLLKTGKIKKTQKVKENIRILNFIPPSGCPLGFKIFSKTKNLPDVDYQEVEKTRKQKKQEIAEYGKELEVEIPIKSSKLNFYIFNPEIKDQLKPNLDIFYDIRIDTKFNKTLGIELTGDGKSAVKKMVKQIKKKGLWHKNTLTCHVLYQDNVVDERLFKEHDFSALIRTEEEIVKDQRFQDMLNELADLYEGFQ